MKACNLSDRNTFYASDELLFDAKLKNSPVYVNFAYTDYGGSFFDKVCIEYFKKYHPENIMFEDTSWNGQNAFIFGRIALTFLDKTDNYLLGFEDIEDFYSSMEYEQISKCFENYLLNINKDLLTYSIEKTLAFIIEEKSGYYSMLPNYLDFSEDDINNFLIENNYLKDD